MEQLYVCMYVNFRTYFPKYMYRNLKKSSWRFEHSDLDPFYADKFLLVCGAKISSKLKLTPPNQPVRRIRERGVAPGVAQKKYGHTKPQLDLGWDQNMAEAGPWVYGGCWLIFYNGLAPGWLFVNNQQILLLTIC